MELATWYRKSVSDSPASVVCWMNAGTTLEKAWNDVCAIDWFAGQVNIIRTGAWISDGATCFGKCEQRFVKIDNTKDLERYVISTFRLDGVSWPRRCSNTSIQEHTTASLISLRSSESTNRCNKPPSVTSASWISNWIPSIFFSNSLEE